VPEILVRGVLEWLAERGYDQVEEVVSAEERLLFALPPELRRDMKAASARTPLTTPAMIKSFPSDTPACRDGKPLIIARRGRLVSDAAGGVGARA
jgi:4-hydroxy-3-methylbut-2-enyl diphosphate reductase